MSNIPVKKGGKFISDFDDLKIAFLDLLDKHNKLVRKVSSMDKELDKEVMPVIRNIRSNI